MISSWIGLNVHLVYGIGEESCVGSNNPTQKSLTLCVTSHILPLDVERSANQGSEPCQQPN
jgi:hypothetical protein